MNELENLSHYQKLLSDEDLVLGKRHRYKKEKQKCFESSAASIGFSKEEIEALGEVYVGFAKPATYKQEFGD